VGWTWRLAHNPHTQQDYQGAVEKVAHTGQEVIRVQAGEAGHLQWTGTIISLERHLDWPTTKWKQPRKIFVSNMGDLFDQDVPEEFILRVFQAMLSAPQHTYQLLTKEPGRLVSLLPAIAALLEAHGLPSERWPSNWWAGVSVENPAWYWRIREIIKVPAAVHFISAEPLLRALVNIPLEHVEWVIAGCESGPGARPMDEEWVKQLFDDTKRVGASFFYKQRLDERGHKVSLPVLRGRSWAEFPDVEAA
jgi:protein gp37